MDVDSAKVDGAHSCRNGSYIKDHSLRGDEEEMVKAHKLSATTDFSRVFEGGNEA